MSQMTAEQNCQLI